MVRIVPTVITVTSSIIQLAQVVAQAEVTKTTVAGFAAVFFGGVALHSASMYANWPFEGSCSFTEIPKYFFVTTLFGGLSFLTAKVAYQRLEALTTASTTLS